MVVIDLLRTFVICLTMPYFIALHHKKLKFEIAKTLFTKMRVSLVVTVNRCGNKNRKEMSKGSLQPFNIHSDLCVGDMLTYTIS